ncbi:MAG: hypothetical protein JSV88_22890 [Candidatus Aminicenantes bacterium]|nr:MAG: hypothetical protein JSV88_22890 [Candidatus Aminicenantes bacterium]
MAKLIKDISKTQKRINDRLIEKALSAKRIGIKIDTRKAPISLFELRQFLIERLISSGGRPKLDGASKKRNKIPLLEDDWNKLKSIADYYKKKDGINVSPGQLVSAIVHSFISHIDIAKDV